MWCSARRVMSESLNIPTRREAGSYVRAIRNSCAHLYLLILHNLPVTIFKVTFLGLTRSFLSSRLFLPRPLSPSFLLDDRPKNGAGFCHYTQGWSSFLASVFLISLRQTIEWTLMFFSEPIRVSFIRWPTMSVYEEINSFTHGI